MLNKLRRGLCLLMAVCFLSGTALAAENDAPEESDGEEAPYDGYIVKVKETANLQSAGKGLLWSSLLSQLKRVSGGLYHAESESEVDRLRQSGLLEYAEPDYIITLGELPDDTYLTTGDQWYYRTLGLDGCRERNFTGQGVRVGVIDSGIYDAHEDFAGAHIVPGTNYAVSSGSAARSDTSDTYGHGTLVSGLIAASVGNGKGIAGAAPSVELVALKAFNGGSGRLSSIIDAVYGGVDDYHCQVLNMSLGTEIDSEALHAAVRYAYQSGVIVVAAAGNRKSASDRTGDDPAYYPASWPEAIGVGAVDQALQSPWYSYHNDSVWVVAPGSGICGPSHQGETKYRLGSVGTSYSAPLVSAAAALCLSVRPALTPDEFSALLRDTARDLGEPGRDHAFGYGLMNAGLMVAALRGDAAWQAVCLAGEFTHGERILLAGYTDNGSLVCVHEAGSTAALPDTATSWRLYVLDGENLAPIQEPYTLWRTPWTPAAESEQAA